MSRIIDPNEPEQQYSPLEVSSHVVTRVYCDNDGLVCYERDGAEDIKLNAVSPKRSRVEALRRADSLLDGMLHDTDGSASDIALNMALPISITGNGLTYGQLKTQTMDAVLKSRKVEAEKSEALQQKIERYKL